MKLNQKLMDVVINDLKKRGASVMVIVSPTKNHNHDWMIDAKWKTGRHWQVIDISGA